MDTRTFRERAQEKVVWARTQLDLYERELDRFRRIVTSLEEYLANDPDDTSDAQANHPSPVVRPQTDKRPSAILLPIVRQNPNLSTDEAYQRLIQAGYDFKDGNQSRVTANALSMAVRKFRAESSEAGTVTAEK